MSNHRRLKVLVSAYACSPFQGSEPGVGWGFVRALSELHDMWVITEEEKFREPIGRYLREHPELARSVRFSFLRKQRNRWLRKVWPPSYYWYYRAWHRRALDVAAALHREVHFDVAHQLTMVGFREPGYLWQLEIPFVWGPVGGMGVFPWTFLPGVGAGGAVRYLGYNVYNVAQTRWLQRPRRAARAAGAGLITATRENRDGALRHWGCDSRVLSEIGLPPRPIATEARRRDPRRPLALVWSGQHTPGKALHLALQAAARVGPGVDWTLDILGEGERTADCKRLAAQLGILGRCRFHGWLERPRALRLMQDAHALVITSMRDLTSTVTVEALSLGLPVLCPDHCGFADAIDASCGITIAVRRPAQFLDDLAAAVTRLARDEDLRYALAQGALRRAPLYDWRAKAERVDEVYRAVVVAAEPEPRRRSMSGAPL